MNANDNTDLVGGVSTDRWIKFLTFIASVNEAYEHRALAILFARQFGHLADSEFLTLISRARGPFWTSGGEVNIDARSFAAFALEEREARA